MSERRRSDSGGAAPVAGVGDSSRLVVEQSPDGTRVCMRKNDITIFMSTQEWEELVALARSVRPEAAFP
jgi:hypothetical protein